MGGFVFINRYHLKSFEAFLRQFGIILLLNLFIGFIFDSVDLSAHMEVLLLGLLEVIVYGGLIKYYTYILV